MIIRFLQITTFLFGGIFTNQILSQENSISYGIQIEVGISETEPFVDFGNRKVNYSYNLGGQIEKSLAKNYSIELAILFVQINSISSGINGKVRFLSQEVEGIRMGESKVYKSFIGIPIQVYKQINRFQIGAGFQTNLYLKGKSINDGIVRYNSGVEEQILMAINRKYQNRIDIGSRLGINYRINEKIDFGLSWHRNIFTMSNNKIWKYKDSFHQILFRTKINLSE